MTSGRPSAGEARTWMRDRLLRLSITLYVIPFLLSGIFIGFAAGGRIADVRPWSGAGGFAAMIVVCAAVVMACVYLAGLVAWTLMAALLLLGARRLPWRRWGLALVSDAPPPWYGHPLRWIADLLQRCWPLPAAAADAGRSGPL